MTSKDRVMAAFAHQETDRVPIWVGMSGEFQDKAQKSLGLDEENLRIRFGDDFRRVSARYGGPEFPMMSGGHTRTVFGVYHGGHGYGIPLNHPFAENTDMADIIEYAWPDPKWMDVSSIRSSALAWKGEYAILGGDWSPLWHDLIDLFGMEKMYYLMYDSPELIDAALERITSYYFEVSHSIFEAANGGIDSHHILINGTPDSVRSATRDILSVMAPGGGYVAGASHDSILEETPVENVIAMCNAVKEF